MICISTLDNHQSQYIYRTNVRSSSMVSCRQRWLIVLLSRCCIDSMSWQSADIRLGKYSRNVTDFLFTVAPRFYFEKLRFSQSNLHTRFKFDDSYLFAYECWVPRKLKKIYRKEKTFTFSFYIIVFQGTDVLSCRRNFWWWDRNANQIRIKKSQMRLKLDLVLNNIYM